MKTLTYAGLAILPLFFSAQAQIGQTKAPIVAVAKTTSVCTDAVDASVSESVFENFYQNISEQISRLEQARLLLDDEVNKSLDNIDVIKFSSEELSKITKLVGRTTTAIGHTKGVISESFDSILKDPKLKILSPIADLRDRALKGMDNLMLTINKVSELRKTLENRQETIVVIDIDRMNHAINSTRHSAPKGMTREERRQFILSRATA
ncbi:hypothetical protein [Proteus mirabilis]|uniref:hypothetical protein n=1 Tax=Proteus mirabilis TaxID=584 RepID=UPI0012EB7590|nr:hypothetical protein [Proteus mirabilis]MVD51385.1 hypothetical protein [Proteus mirabilis]MVD73694.1 hypothetical protein [Proteus mirabilis]MVF42699.1 hypothetical protein [Proteus mirabilis]QKQ95251.1 hypothetical protein GCE56_06625 [Proteus mirabilis]UHD50917.1 hypothetical protein LUA10_06230 [Proteus mirabilis]